VTSCFDEGARNGGPSDVNQLLGKSLSRQMALGDAGVKMGWPCFGAGGSNFRMLHTNISIYGGVNAPDRWQMAFYVYIMASRRNGTLYIGSTDDLARRVFEHQSRVRGFTARYGCTMLVWFEQHETRESALIRERRMKEWRRSWKLMVIEENNPDWRNLALEFLG
jgi:putative endonuclease